MAKIAVTGFRGVPAGAGGVEQQCEHIYSRLAQRGYEITIYARSHYVPKDVRWYRGMRVRRLPTIDTKYTEAFVHTFLAVCDIILSDAEIVHIYSQGPCLFSPLLRLFKPRARIFFTCGGLDWQRKKWSKPASWAIRLGELCSAVFPHRCITVSKELKKYYRSRYGVDASYIPNGMVKAEKKPPESVAGLGLDPGGYFLFVGRLVPEKRIQDIIAAFMKTTGRCQLAIVGDSAGTEDYVTELRRMAQGDARVKFLGYRYGDELAALYSNARAFINPSELEGLPLTVLEALSYGLVCLVSDIPPHREIFELGEMKGHFFQVGDIDSLAMAMEQVRGMTREELETVGSQVCKLIEECYSWDRAALELERLYEASSGNSGA
ncbi:MAG: glycosyltransferase family 4 protein [Acidobacteriota bacterium]